MARAAVDKILFFDIGTLYKSLVDYFVSKIIDDLNNNNNNNNNHKF